VRPFNGEADAIVVGGGLVGLCCAKALAERKLRVLLIAEEREGEASSAAAGMLAPSIDRASGAAHSFALAARDRYPSYIAALRDEVGMDVPLNLRGIVALALHSDTAEETRRALPPDATWMDREQLRHCEPALAHAAGAAFYPQEGAVDNIALLGALRHAIIQQRGTFLVRRSVSSIDLGHPHPIAVTTNGEKYRAPRLVLAAGAWVGQIEGLPRRIPVEPVRGQMVSLTTVPIRHVAVGPRGYTVPRGASTVAGSTMERVGFNATTTPDGVAAVLESATEISPAFAAAEVQGRWSGLRPITPDLLPVLGPDPAYPSLLYACGHSRNGILLGPLTGDCIGALVSDGQSPHSLEPFSIARFDPQQ
jgi:glycine oxidase ThiO